MRGGKNAKKTEKGSTSRYVQLYEMGGGISCNVLFFSLLLSQRAGNEKKERKICVGIRRRTYIIEIPRR